MVKGFWQKEQGQATVEAIYAFVFFFILFFGLIECGYLLFSVSEANAQVQKAGTMLDVHELLSAGDAKKIIAKTIVENSTAISEDNVKVSNVCIDTEDFAKSQSVTDTSVIGVTAINRSMKSVIVEYDVDFTVPLLFRLFEFDTLPMTRHVEYEIPCQDVFEVVK